MITRRPYYPADKGSGLLSVVGKARASATRPVRRLRFTHSADYWERRYAAGGTSGAGSYGEVARFKAAVLNGFVAERSVGSVLEFGCGDGNQLALASYPTYIGLDVSASALDLCMMRFSKDDTKSFLLYEPTRFVNHGAMGAELAISLDVILHLVEDAVFETHMRQLFDAAGRYVAIFSSNEEISVSEPHVRHRAFTSWIRQHRPQWTMTDRVDNPHKGAESVADFYIYERGCAEPVAASR